MVAQQGTTVPLPHREIAPTPKLLVKLSVYSFAGWKLGRPGLFHERGFLSQIISCFINLFATSVLLLRGAVINSIETTKNTLYETIESFI
jgi:hypothetical protein